MYMLYDTAALTSQYREAAITGGLAVFSACEASVASWGCIVKPIVLELVANYTVPERPGGLYGLPLTVNIKRFP